MDHAHPGGQGVGRRPEVAGCTVDADLALVGTVDTGQDIHQGGLSRPVFSQNGVHCSGQNG